MREKRMQMDLQKLFKRFLQEDTLSSTNVSFDSLVSACMSVCSTTCAPESLSSEEYVGIYTRLRHALTRKQCPGGVSRHEERETSLSTNCEQSKDAVAQDAIAIKDSIGHDASQNDAIVMDTAPKNVIAKDVKNVVELFNILDKKLQQDVYDNQPCRGKKVLVVGAGPCGLRAAIECALLGADVTVVESRDYVSRNNVLHLWPFVTRDIKSLGGKIFFPQFCNGSVEHISIRRLQLILVKVALLFGVKVHVPVQFIGLQEPDPEQGTGWRAVLNLLNDPVTSVDYDIVIGASGKFNALPDFSKRCFRGKLAIAITANFVNRRNLEDTVVPERPGLLYCYDQPFFQGLKQRAGLDLENFVYFRDETHYFVVTAKKKCLLEKGVLKEDLHDAKSLLDGANITQDKLEEFAISVAHETTDGKLKNPVFAENHRHRPDVAIFDFTAMHNAKHSCFVREQHGHTLVQCLVGDSLIEPFWPAGSGCAKGFLGVMDTAWFIRSWCLPTIESKLKLIADRESSYALLMQTIPPMLNKKLASYTIDPSTRYGTVLTTRKPDPESYQHLYKR